MKGKVWLVGAGPTDIGLLTLRGKEVIENADVVVYDKLVGQGILNLIPKSSKKIYVGKKSGHHIVKQERINEILLEEALDGKKVVRLKGGDPFLFGRGGEELELLVEHNIDFEIVPGITSAISVPAYSGIPVTHRDFVSSVHIITGHKKSDEELDIDFASLVRLNGTLVFLMGVSSLKVICESLIENGMDKTTPACIIENGTSSKQRRVVATLENLYERATEEKIKTPGLIVVGHVVSLSDKFSWYEKKPLSNVRVLVTRPRELVSRLSKKLCENGAEVIEMPTIERVKRDDASLLDAIKNIKSYEWIILTSQIGVDIFFDSLIENKIDIRSLSGLKFGAVGPATAKAIEKRGIIPEFIPSVYKGDILAREIAPLVKGRVLLARASGANSDITDIFNSLSIEYDDVFTYDTKTIKNSMDSLEFDCVAFTSASTVEGFVKSFKGIEYEKILGVCIGDSTKKACEKYNMKTITAKEATLDSMVEAIEILKEKNNGFIK